jgi:hypothetical protein
MSWSTVGTDDIDMAMSMASSSVAFPPNSDGAGRPHKRLWYKRDSKGISGSQ